MLRLSRFGRLVLSRKQVIASNVIGGLLLLAIGALATGLIRGDDRWLILALVLAVLTIPTAGTFNTPSGWPLWVMIAATSGLALLGLTAIGLMLLVPDYSADTDHWLIGLGMSVLSAFTWGVLITSIGSNYLRAVKPRR
jgi:hypothetical protein